MNKLVTTVENRRDIVALANAGTQEICLAVKGFSITALQSFTLEEIAMYIESAKDFDLEVSVLVNKLFHEDDLESVKDCLQELKRLQINSIYFADLSILHLAQEMDMLDKLIYMPDTMMTSPQDAKFYIDLGLQGVSISALLTKEETKEIVKEAKKVVVPVFGHMVMSFSYRKLLSSWKKAFSSKEDVVDRKDLYLVEEKRDGHMPIYECKEGTLIYTDYVLDSFDLLKEFQEVNTPVYFMTGVFMDRLAYIEAVHLTKEILDGKDMSKEVEIYKQKYPMYTFLEGYYNEKTVR